MDPGTSRSRIFNIGGNNDAGGDRCGLSGKPVLAAGKIGYGMERNRRGVSGRGRYLFGAAGQGTVGI